MQSRARATALDRTVAWSRTAKGRSSTTMTEVAVLCVVCARCSLRHIDAEETVGVHAWSHEASTQDWKVGTEDGVGAVVAAWACCRAQDYVPEAGSDGAGEATAAPFLVHVVAAVAAAVADAARGRRTVSPGGGRRRSWRLGGSG